MIIASPRNARSALAPIHLSLFFLLLVGTAIQGCSGSDLGGIQVGNDEGTGDALRDAGSPGGPQAGENETGERADGVTASQRAGAMSTADPEGSATASGDSDGNSDGNSDGDGDTNSTASPDAAIGPECQPPADCVDPTPPQAATTDCETNNGGCGDPEFWQCTETDEGTACADIPECATDNGGCGEPAFWQCTEQAGAAPACTAVSLCATDNGGCGDPAFWQCVERVGEAPECRDIDECGSNNGGCGAPADFSCRNLEGKAPECSPIGKCAVNNGNCGDPKLFRCFDNGSTAECSDIDECATNNGGCGDAKYSRCENQQGAAPKCSDIDECATNNGGCGAASQARCQDKVGAAPACSDIDECATNNGGCNREFTRCVNQDRAAVICRDIDECASNNGGCGSAALWQCVNTDGGPPMCVDVDECKTNNGGCGPSRCINNPGGPATCMAQAPVCGDNAVNGNEVCDPSANGQDLWHCTEDCQPRTLYTTCQSEDDCDAASTCNTQSFPPFCSPLTTTGQCPTLWAEYTQGAFTADSVGFQICVISCNVDSDCPRHLFNCKENTAKRFLGGPDRYCVAPD